MLLHLHPIEPRPRDFVRNSFPEVSRYHNRGGNYQEYLNFKADKGVGTEVHVTLFRMSESFKLPNRAIHSFNMKRLKFPT